MSRRWKRSDVKTPDFFAPTFNPIPIKKAIAADIKASKKSREQIADLMSGYLARKINVTEIDTWTASSKPGHLPRADEIAAFIWATGCGLALEALGDAAGMHVVDRPDAELLEIARLSEERDRIDENIKHLKTKRGSL